VGGGEPPERPLLHVGATAVAVHARPLADDLVRLRLERPLPLRVGDRAILRDPGSRAIWGVHVLDPAPPPLRRRGAAAARARDLSAVDGSCAAEVRLRGLVRRSLLRRIGVPDAPVPDDAVAAGDWLVSAGRAASLARDLEEVVRKASTPFDPGVTLLAAARALGLDEPDLVRVLARPPLRVEGGRVLPADDGLPPALTAALADLRAELADHQFAAPDAARLATLRLDPAAVGLLARGGHLLRVGDTVLLPGADDLAVERLAALPQPFTTSEARQALGTSRRVALPLLALLDRTGRTVRLPDDRRRLR
jgi:selenocysteine-specific elongation factor